MTLETTIKRDRVQFLIYGLVESENNLTRKAYLRDLWEDSWFGSLSSIEEFMEAHDELFTPEEIAREYVENA